MKNENSLPLITADTEKLRHNARCLTDICARQGIGITGVVKCCCGSPEVARAFLAGGTARIGDSRIRNLRRLRENGIAAPLWLLRLPMPGEVEETVRCADLSLNSSFQVLEMLSEAAVRAGKLHQVLLMTDLGDRREGVQPGELEDLFKLAESLPGLYPAGIGTNLSCYGGVIPDEQNMGLLAELAEKIEKDHHRKLRYVSAGNSSALPMLLAGRLPACVNDLRCGEALLLGRETCDGQKLPGMHDDAFTLTVEVIEAAVKPSAPSGTVKLNAFGEKPQIRNEGNRRRLLLGIGREDLPPEGITPRLPGLRVLGASSDHLIVDAEECAMDFKPGDSVEFSLEYGALLAGMTSPYVSKRFINETPVLPKRSGLTILTYAGAPGPFRETPELLSRSLASAGRITRCREREELAAVLRETREADRLPLLLAATHDTAEELAKDLAGHYGSPGWVTFSAFSDFNTDETGPGTPAGRTLSRICGKTGGGHLPEKPLPPENTVLIGLRNVEKQERMALRDSGILVFTMEEVDRFGMPEIIERTLCRLNHVQAIAVDFVMNVLDPEFIPGGDREIPGCGLTMREAFCALEMLTDSGKVAGAVFSEVPPGDGAVRNCSALAKALAGEKILR